MFARELIGYQGGPRKIGDRGILNAHINDFRRACSEFYDCPEANPAASHQVECHAHVCARRPSAMIASALAERSSMLVPGMS